jgi:hypothetical protein
MPTRMLREGLLDSERYSHLSDQGKLFFVHLILIADDFGCLSLSPAYLRRRIFYNAPSNELIAKLICEVADADLIRTYEVDRRALAFIPRFGQRLRINKSKYPIPAPLLYDDDLEAKNKFNNLIQKMTDICPTDDGQMTVKCPPEVEVKGSRREVEEKLKLRAPVDNFRENPKPIETIHGKTYSQWLKDLNIPIQPNWTSADAKLAVDRALETTSSTTLDSRW